MLEPHCIHGTGASSPQPTDAPTGARAASSDIPLPSVTVERVLDLVQRVPDARDVVLVCRRGKDSQQAVQLLLSAGIEDAGSLRVRDLRGGLVAWAVEGDRSFPIY